MTKIINATRPAGQRVEYRFFKDTDTSRTFKAMAQFEEILGAAPVMKLSISEVDAAGTAIKDEAGEAIVFWHSHTFTEVELKDPTFNAEARSAAMLTAAIGNQEVVRAGREKLQSLKTIWPTPSAINTTPPPTQ